MSDSGNIPPRTRFENEERLTPDIIPMHHPIMRELAEPKDGFEPTPVWLMLLYFALIGWGGFYLATNSGAFRADIFTDGPSQRLAFGGGETRPAAPADPMALGQRVYANCAACHQADGKGVEGVYPPLADSSFVNGPPEQLIRIVLHGLNGPLTVHGKTYNGEMPAWGQLPDNQIAAVLTYVRASFGNGSPAVSEEAVKAEREATSGRARPWTAAELASAATSK
ncbi:MAG TPA: cytochrome c [Bryobacteraceae bacterium]|nr:cytochrome c [Bryobacteraceae bacterium]